MQNYEVGQIVYLLIKGEMKVVPVRVVEAITRRSLDGTSVTYMVQFPTKERTVVDLSEVDAEPYSELSRVREVMLERVTTSIENAIKRTETIARSFAAAAADAA
jgi:predicted amino acid racemase